MIPIAFRDWLHLHIVEQLGIGRGLAYFITPNVWLGALLKYPGIVGWAPALPRATW